jgi:hypothetical protein
LARLRSIQEGKMTPRTIFLSRLIGIYCLIAAASMFLQHPLTIACVTALMEDAPLLWFMSLLVVVAGVAMVLAHNRWSGGVRVVAVTIIGWLALAKGVVYLCFPCGAVTTSLVKLIAHDAVYYAVAALVLAMGAFFALSGFRAPSQSQS